MIRDPEFSAAVLLTHYSFDLQGSGMEGLINHWMYTYPKKWVIAAILEALYQGRYKVSSVSRILDSWQSKGYPMAHFDHDFADIAYKKLMRSVVVMEQFKCIISDQEDNTEELKKAKDVEPEVEISVSADEDGSVVTPVRAKRKNVPNPGINEWARLTQRLVG